MEKGLRVARALFFLNGRWSRSAGWILLVLRFVSQQGAHYGSWDDALHFIETTPSSSIVACPLPR